MISRYTQPSIKPENEAAIEIALRNLVNEIKDNEKAPLCIWFISLYIIIQKLTMVKNKYNSEPEIRHGTLVFVESKN